MAQLPKPRLFFANKSNQKFMINQMVQIGRWNGDPLAPNTA